MLVQSSLQVVCHAGVQDSISFVGQKVDIILFHALTAFLGVEFAEAFLLSERVLRDYHVGLRPPRNDKSGGQHRFNGGQYGSGVPSRDCHVGLRPPRNDKSGVHAGLTVARSERQCLPEIATSASGLLAMTNRGASTVLTAAGTDRGCLPEIATSASGLLAMTNRRCVPFLRWLVPNGSAFPRLPRRFAPRNDKSEVRTVFTMARSERQCLPEIATAPLGPRNDKSGSRYDQLNLPRILRFPPYWRSPRRR